MSEIEKKHLEALGKQAVKALNAKRFIAQFAATKEEAVQAILSLIKDKDTVGMGGSETTEELKLKSELEKRGNIIYYHQGLPPEESRIMRCKELTADVFLTSTNAVTLEGELINVDGSGNRVAAMALGGNVPTLSDALITIGLVNFGDSDLAGQAMKLYAVEQESTVDVAKAIVDVAVKKIENTIDEMLKQWSVQPVYTVDDIITGSLFKPELLIGVGGAAPGLIKLLGERMHLPVEIPEGAMVANAIGAALAKPTLVATLRADTTEDYYIIPEAGIKAKLPGGFNQYKAQELLTAWYSYHMLCCFVRSTTFCKERLS